MSGTAKHSLDCLLPKIRKLVVIHEDQLSTQRGCAVKYPCCGSGELMSDAREVSYIYKGITNVIPAVTGDFCSACGEVILNREQGDRYSEIVGQIQRQHNAA